MAAMLNSFKPLRKKDQYNHERALNTRWGDAAISAPMHGGWNTSANSQPQESPDLDRDLPPTPPQGNDVVDGVFIVHDEEAGNQSDDDAADGQGRDNVTITIPLPWKKRKDSHTRKQSQPANSVINPKFAAPRRIDQTPPLATAEAAAIVPLPDSRVSSPVARTTTTPVLSFRSRLAHPSLADILSPVAEGFAKDGPSSRATPPIPSMQEEQADPIERPSTGSSLRSNIVRRASITQTYNSEGLGGTTMSSQAINDDQLPEYNRPASRGIGSTAHMRASSRGPRASSRGPRSTSVDPVGQRSGSVEPYPRRAPSVEPITRRAPSVEPVEWRAPSVEPITRRAPSVEPITRRAPSVEPVGRRAGSVEPLSRSRAPSVEPMSRRAPSVEPVSHRSGSVDPYYRRAPSVEPISRRIIPLEPTVYRAASVEPHYRRAPSVEPIMRRAPSVEPIASRGHSVDPYSRRGQSVDPYSHGGNSSDLLSRRGHSVEPFHYQPDIHARIVLPASNDLEPVRKRAPSVEPGRRRAPSVDPSSKRGLSIEPILKRNEESDEDRARRRAPSLGAPSSRRAISREPRGRRGGSVEPRPRVRFQSEVIRPHRRDSFSSNDGSLESDEDREELQPERFSPPSRRDPDFTTTRKPRRRRSIASPMTSPTAAVFNISQHAGPSPPPSFISNMDSISSRAGIARPIITPMEKRPQSRNRSTSRARGLYADLQDDFSNLAREVQSDDRHQDPAIVPLPIITQIPRNRGDTPVNQLNTQLPHNPMNFSSRAGSPLSGPNQPIYQAGIGTMVMNQNQNQSQYDSDRNGYTSDSSQPSLASMSGMLSSDSERFYDSSGGAQGQAIFARDRRDQLRREERERAREKVARKLERERERVMAENAFAMSDYDSQQESLSGNERTRNVYGGSIASDTEREFRQLVQQQQQQPQQDKVLVPNHEEIWG